ncbi:hypothetical protein Tco_1411705 [Tanacetum coccineum]
MENKSRTSENEDVKINTRCSTILQNQLSPKEQDPWSFTLPCSIGKLTFNALADLGANISLMPFSMFKRLGIRGLKPINMTIEMADRTQSTPKGIMENILLKIDKFIFLVDLVILDMVEDFRMPIILGRPLLATAHAKVDIFRKSVSLEVGNQKVIFKTKNNSDKTLVETVCAIRNEKSVINDDIMKIDHDLCSKLDQGKPWEIEANEELNRERDIDLSSVIKLKEHWCKAILQQKEKGMNFGHHVTYIMTNVMEAMYLTTQKRNAIGVV